MPDVTVHILRQIDVAESIDVAEVERLVSEGAVSGGARLGTTEPDPPGVVLLRRPVDLSLDQVTVGPFELRVRVRVFDFGVVAVRFTLARTGLSSRELIQIGVDVAALSTAFDAEALRIWGVLEPTLRPTLTPDDPPPEGPLVEDFTVFVLPGPVPEETIVPGLVHLLLGEPQERRLAPSLCRGFLDMAIRYYEDDLVLLSWDAAVIVEPAGALDVVNVLEMASAQLLEVRYYAGIVRRATVMLAADAERARTGRWLFRSPFTSLAQRAAIMALELGEMTARLETAVALVGDSYTVKVFTEATRRFRLVESRRAVREEIETLAKVTETFGGEVESRRGLFLEILVVILILIEVLKAW